MSSLDKITQDMIDKVFYGLGTQDLGYEKYEKDYATIFTFDINGINQEDLVITRTSKNGKNEIKVKGTTTDTIVQKTHTIDKSLILPHNNYDLKLIYSTIKNGILYITVPFKKYEEVNEIVNIKIN